MNKISYKGNVRFCESLDRGHTYITVEVDGLEISSCNLSSSGWITSVQTEEAYQRQGYASAMFEALIAYAREHGIARLGLDTFYKNKAAVKLYKKFGFTAREKHFGRMDLILHEFTAEDYAAIEHKIDEHGPNRRAFNLDWKGQHIGWLNMDDNFQLLTAVVNDDWDNMGMEALLVQDALNFARENKLRLLTCIVQKNETAMLNALRDAGFVKLRTMKGGTSRVMLLQLNPFGL